LVSRSHPLGLRSPTFPKVFRSTGMLLWLPLYFLVPKPTQFFFLTLFYRRQKFFYRLIDAMGFPLFPIPSAFHLLLDLGRRDPRSTSPARCCSFFREFPPGEAPRFRFSLRRFRTTTRAFSRGMAIGLSGAALHAFHCGQLLFLIAFTGRRPEVVFFGLETGWEVQFPFLGLFGSP